MNPLEYMSLMTDRVTNNDHDQQPSTSRKRPHSEESDPQPSSQKYPKHNGNRENRTPTPPAPFNGPPVFHSTPLFPLPQHRMPFADHTNMFPFVPFPTFSMHNDSVMAMSMNNSTDSGAVSDMSNSFCNRTVQSSSSSLSDETSAADHHEYAGYGLNERKAGPSDDSDPFAVVPGRTCVLGNATKYTVTIGEIKRRTHPPECLHASLINGILRRAKAKDGNKALREELSRVGIALPCGRRKTAPATAFSALCEDEAVGMAKDFMELCERDFPARQVAQELITRSLPTPPELLKTRHELEVLGHYATLLKQLIAPVGVKPGDFKKEAPAHGAASAINNFSLLTHGFGHNAVSGVLTALHNVAVEGVRNIDSVLQQSQQNAMMWPMHTDAFGF